MTTQNPHLKELIEAKRTYDIHSNAMHAKYGYSRNDQMTVKEIAEQTTMAWEYREQAALFMVYNGG